MKIVFVLAIVACLAVSIQATPQQTLTTFLSNILLSLGSLVSSLQNIVNNINIPGQLQAAIGILANLENQINALLPTLSTAQLQPLVNPISNLYTQLQNLAAVLSNVNPAGVTAAQKTVLTNVLTGVRNTLTQLNIAG